MWNNMENSQGTSRIELSQKLQRWALESSHVILHKEWPGIGAAPLLFSLLFLHRVPTKAVFLLFKNSPKETNTTLSACNDSPE